MSSIPPLWPDEGPDPRASFEQLFDDATLDLDDGPIEDCFGLLRSRSPGIIEFDGSIAGGYNGACWEPERRDPAEVARFWRRHAVRCRRIGDDGTGGILALPKLIVPEPPPDLTARAGVQAAPSDGAPPTDASPRKQAALETLSRYLAERRSTSPQPPTRSPRGVSSPSPDRRLPPTLP